MSTQIKPILLLLVFFSTSLLSISAQEVENEREFDYMENSGKGPKHWGDLKKEWESCKRGGMQSPVDLSDQRVKMVRKTGEMQRTYNRCHATLKNRGHDISLQWGHDEAGSIKVNSTDYFLQQGHWHSPSEHTLNGRRYALELHLVHVSPDPNVKNNITVLGALYKFGEPDAFLSKLISNVSSMGDQVHQKDMGVVDPSEIKLGGRKYYRYVGSLTVPPCTEGVIWSINKKIRTVSRDQVTALKIAVHDYAVTNARPTQPLHGRQVELYGPNL